MTYHFHYIAIVWNRNDHSDMQIIKDKFLFGMWSTPIFFGTHSDVERYAKSKGFKNFESVLITTQRKIKY